jgi:hypothetical protein
LGELFFILRVPVEKVLAVVISLVEAWLMAKWAAEADVPESPVSWLNEGDTARARPAAATAAAATTDSALLRPAFI